jgi:hypothetical protein
MPLDVENTSLTSLCVLSIMNKKQLQFVFQVDGIKNVVYECVP